MKKLRKIHFISIGGGAMSDLAIAMKKVGHDVTGSDEEIGDPVRSKLEEHGLPAKTGWDPEKLNSGVDTVVMGPQAAKDNPELKRARELRLGITSFHDLIYEQAQDKLRVVIAGTQSKAMIAALIVHVLKFYDREFDYSLSHHVKLTNAPLIIIEGQEVMTSSIDPIPAFLKYRHHVGVISGIEWRESESYPTKEEYVRQFGVFGGSTPKGGILVYLELEPVVTALSAIMGKPDVLFVPYKAHPSINDGGQEFLLTSDKARLPLKITGKHNFQNISAAQEVLKRIGITSEMFYQAVSSFTGLGI